MFPRDPSSHSGPPVTNVTMLCLPGLLTLAGRKAVIRLSQDSDWPAPPWPLHSASHGAGPGAATYRGLLLLALSKRKRTILSPL